MAILLLGEFSALHKNLKEGLNELGYETLIASAGDGWKNIPRDIDLCGSSSNNILLNQVLSRLTTLLKVKKLINFDVVQLINPFGLHGRYFPSKLFLDYIVNNNSKSFMLAAGDDAFFWKYGRKNLKYGPFDDFLKYDLRSDKYYMQKDKAYNFNKHVACKVDGIIPVMYEYEISYQGHKNLKDTIPIPINTQKIKYIENIVSNKLVVFHGLNRYGFKGTRHVEEAFEILSDRYPNHLELIIDGKMPLDTYLEVMNKANVIIDQVNSHSLGVNGIYALAMGKIVLGGAEPESLNSLGVKKSPVINIKPSALSIVEEIEKLLDNKIKITEHGYESRKFAEKVHGHIDIAKKYIKTWGLD